MEVHLTYCLEPDAYYYKQLTKHIILHSNRKLGLGFCRNSKFIHVCKVEIGLPTHKMEIRIVYTSLVLQY